ncbi:MAG TPA: hypothetical protein VEU62_12110, partial [Bryobacterales bacterium]|nr:hypothetical protein [Bryobacterales bacterium]
MSFAWCAGSALAQNGPKPEVTPEVNHAVSPPLRNIPRSVHEPGPPHLIPLGKLRPNLPPPGQVDPVIQSSASASLPVTSGLNFAGVGNGDYGFTPDAAPPDTNLSVGATQVVQWVNESFAVFNKSTGVLEAGPTPANLLWTSLGGPCATNNDGDPIAQYDKAANRWVLSQFSVTGGPPFLQCVAVSQGPDATGAYNLYAFSEPNFNDYPKMGIWTDGYYETFNMFQGNLFVGARVCAFDRTSMMAGSAATQVCFQLSSSFDSVLPSDLDGSTLPPVGSPNFLLNFGLNSLNFWQFHADFATPSNSTLSGPVNIPVAAFSPACNGGVCIPQSGTRELLDSLGDRLMYRLAYRNFGGHEAMVVNHSVAAGNSVGVRWYEVRNPAILTLAQSSTTNPPVVFQQGTFAPDSSYRWMGSIAMDQVGDIALGYSVSSSQMHPAIRYTGRVPTDTAGTMEAENTVIAGGGSQLKNL